MLLISWMLRDQCFMYNFSVLLSWICIDSALLDPDPYSYWERGSGSRSKEINVGMFLWSITYIKYNFSCKNLIFVNGQSLTRIRIRLYQHYFGSLDQNPDLHLGEKKLDPDPQGSQCGSTTLQCLNPPPEFTTPGTLCVRSKQQYLVTVFFNMSFRVKASFMAMESGPGTLISWNLVISLKTGTVCRRTS